MNKDNALGQIANNAVKHAAEQPSQCVKGRRTVVSKTMKNVSPKARTDAVAAPTSKPAAHNEDIRAGVITRLKNTGNETRVVSQGVAMNVQARS